MEQEKRRKRPPNAQQNQQYQGKKNEDLHSRKRQKLYQHETNTLKSKQGSLGKNQEKVVVGQYGGEVLQTSSSFAVQTNTLSQNLPFGEMKSYMSCSAEQQRRICLRCNKSGHLTQECSESALNQDQLDLLLARAAARKQTLTEFSQQLRSDGEILDDISEGEIVEDERVQIQQHRNSNNIKSVQNLWNQKKTSFEPQTPKKNLQLEKNQQSWQLKTSKRPPTSFMINRQNPRNHQNQSKIKSVSLSQPGKIRAMLKNQSPKQNESPSVFDKALVESGGGRITTAEDQDKWMKPDKPDKPPPQGIPLTWHSSHPEIKPQTQSRPSKLPKRCPTQPSSSSKQNQYPTIAASHCQTAQKPQPKIQVMEHQQPQHFPTQKSSQKVPVLETENTQHQQQCHEMPGVDEEQSEILSRINPRFLEYRNGEEEVGQLKELLQQFRKRVDEINEHMRLTGQANCRGYIQGVNEAYKESCFNNEFKARSYSYGHPPGVSIGDWFDNRYVMAITGVHGSLWKGIYGPPQGSGSVLGAASAVCLSGGYADDQDQGDRISYTGEGGRDKQNAQVHDQKRKDGNLALIRSYENCIPVKVSRKIGPRYSYEGLYFVERYDFVESGQERTPASSQTGPQRAKVFIFTLRGVPNHCRTSGKVLGQRQSTLRKSLSIPQPSPLREQLKQQNTKKYVDPQAGNNKTDFAEFRSKNQNIQNLADGVKSKELEHAKSKKNQVCTETNQEDLHDQISDPHQTCSGEFDAEDFGKELEQSIELAGVDTDQCEDVDQRGAENSEDDLHLEFLHQLEYNGKIKILSEDISKGVENVRIPVIVDQKWFNTKFEIQIPEFKYFTDYEGVDFSFDAGKIILDYSSLGQKDCGLEYGTVQESFYNEEGLLKQTQFAGVFECSENCNKFLNACKYNKISQKGIKLPLEVRFIDETRKFGVTCGRDISSGEFICSYMGEVITETEANKLESKRPPKQPNYLVYLHHFIGLHTDEEVSEECKQQLLYIPDEFLSDQSWKPCVVLNAEKQGNVSRFLNHSCEPNLFVQPVIGKGQHGLFYYVCFFAQQEIQAGEELTFDYMDKVHVFAVDKPCLCGSSECRGWVI